MRTTCFTQGIGSYDFAAWSFRDKKLSGFPVWGNMTGNDLVQIITSAELDYYKNIRSILIPEQLKNLGEESNPVFIFYKLKDS